MYDAKSVGKKLQRIRQSVGLQQPEVYTKTGISVNRLSICENGHANLSLEELMKLCQLYCITPNDVLGFETSSEVKSVVSKISTLNTDEIKFITNIIDSYIQFTDKDRERSLEPEM